jgi:hypothetical protein
MTQLKRIFTDFYIEKYLNNFDRRDFLRSAPLLTKERGRGVRSKRNWKLFFGWPHIEGLYD